MKQRCHAALLASALVLVLPGCIVQSLRPFHSEAEKVDPPEALLKKWVLVEQFGEDMAPKKIPAWTFARDHVITIDAENRTCRLDAAFFKIGDTLYADWCAGDPPDGNGPGAVNGYWNLHVAPMHSVTQVRLTGGRLSLVPLNVEWVTKSAQNGTLGLPFIDINPGGDHHLVFTASPEQWCEFLAENGGSKDAFNPENALVFRMAEPF